LLPINELSGLGLRNFAVRVCHFSSSLFALQKMPGFFVAGNTAAPVAFGPPAVAYTLCRGWMPVLAALCNSGENRPHRVGRFE
jgi:hypothetical protein